jgi:hypothetical protein
MSSGGVGDPKGKRGFTGVEGGNTSLGISMSIMRYVLLGGYAISIIKEEQKFVNKKRTPVS